jgi:hypothetical protein
VIEDACRIKDDFKNNHGYGGRPQDENSRHLDSHGEKDFDWMKSDSSSHIEVEIRMMDPVKPPEKRKEMKEGMLKVNDKIEGDYPDDDLQPAGKGKMVQQPPPAVLSNLGYPYGLHRKQNP